MLQHPIITNMELSGYPDGRAVEYPHCPVCGEECVKVHFNRAHEVVGCEECIDTESAWDCEECFPEEDLYS